MVFAGVGVLLSVCILHNKILWGVEYNCNAPISQTARDVRASHGTLINTFERIEMIFRRLEIYAKVPLTVLTSEMMDIIIRIMVEVLSILGIAMKDIKQGRMSKYSLIQVGHC